MSREDNRTNAAAHVFAMLMVVGGLPFSLFLAQVIASAGIGRDGYAMPDDALMLLLKLLLSYCLALTTCLLGIAYFSVKAVFDRFLPRWQHWLVILYTLLQLALPLVYFMNWWQ